MSAPVAPVLGPGTSRAQALRLLRDAFAAAGIEDAALDARILAAEALGVAPLELATRPDEPLGREGAGRLSASARRRLAREPVGRILGRRDFWSLTFLLSPATLEPRPDTEIVVAAALAGAPDRDQALRILDLGTGSSTILIALLVERPAAFGLGIDLAPAALATARANAEANGVGGRAAFAAGSWADALDARFDLVVSNPPYIAGGDIATLAPEVARHDPPVALDGGPDGLAAYREIAAALPRLLAPRGHAVLEIGHDQAGPVARLLGQAGLAVIRTERDLGGRDRALVARHVI